MNWRTIVDDYFTFTRKERIGLLAVVFIIISITILPKVQTGRRVAVPADTTWISAAKKLMRNADSGNEKSITDNGHLDDLAYDQSPQDRKPNTRVFDFDPNNLSIEQWKNLGLRDRTIATIHNYLRKGGHFYKPEDLKKIYGIRADEYKRLQPYIKIASTAKNDSTNIFKPSAYPKSDKKASKNYFVDINIADTTQFIALPGIGSKLASRIVNFREKLGGFYSVDQIGEVYGLQDSTFQKIKPFLHLTVGPIKTININTATKDEMKSHPYIRWALANALVEYRNQHGNYTSIEDIKKMSAISDDVFAKLKPYIVVQ